MAIISRFKIMLSCSKLFSTVVNKSKFNFGFKSCFLSTSHFNYNTSLSVDLAGIFPPIPTSFHPDESISYSDVEKNFEVWNSKAFAGYVVQGSNGEYSYLSTSERVDVVKKVKSLMPSSKLLIAGSGCESTLATVAMTNAMADNGANVAMVVTPSYYKNQMLSDALLRHFSVVADQSNIPVILYNVPVNTGLNIPIEVAVELSHHPNIIGIKESGGDMNRIGLLVHKTSSDFQVLAGSAGFLLASYTLGAVGGVCALANILGEEVCQLGQLYNENRLEEACKLQHRLIEPNAAVTAKYGVPGLKAAMDLFGMKGGRPRLPLQALNEEDKGKVKKAFEDNGFL